MVQIRAGMAPTADELMDMQWRRISQGTDQEVTSTTTLTDSNIVIPCKGRTIVELRINYESDGGGIRWAWRFAGGVGTGDGRWVTTHGEETTGGVLNSTLFQQHRSGSTTERAVHHFTGVGPNALIETLSFIGEGEAIFQFAQQVSDAAPTTLSANSFAYYLRDVTDGD